MSVIYECDGCGKTSKRYREINPVTIEVKSQRGQGPKEFHLCEGCEDTARRHCDPTTWARAKAEPV